MILHYKNQVNHFFYGLGSLGYRWLVMSHSVPFPGALEPGVLEHGMEQLRQLRQLSKEESCLRVPALRRSACRMRGGMSFRRMSF